MDLDSLNNIITKHRYKLISLAAIAVAYYVLIVRNPLPSDEQMIANLYEHRADIEELIRRYRSYPSEPKIDHSKWRKEGDTPALLKRAGIRYIGDVIPGPWLPNPYSIETAKKIEFETKNAKSLAIFHKYGGLNLKPSPRASFLSRHLRYVYIWKDYFYVPEVPRIENDMLLGPYDTEGKYSSRKRVLPSLDSFPDKWKYYECVYRQVEPHWFLRICNGH